MPLPIVLRRVGHSSAWGFCCEALRPGSGDGLCCGAGGDLERARRDGVRRDGGGARRRASRGCGSTRGSDRGRWADIYNQVTTRLGDDVTPAPSLAGADFGSAVQQAYLKASNTGAGDCFGCSVAVSGDTVVVGADGEDSSATGVNGNQATTAPTDSGAAYVFVRSGTTWTQQAYLKASNTGGG